ncbi:MAG: polysaccharide biosynthesis tyrosine autokinase [Desulfuromonadales bacterium]|nr:polysaccharide biosynthesis tyrosine autokinase [Desulfuromonadales bacterium]
MQQFDQPAHQGNLQPEEVHLSDYINVLYRRRKIALAVFAAVVIGVTGYTLTAQPVYEATATLHVKDDKVKGGNFLGELGLSRDNPVQTEIEILKSRTNAEETVRRLHLNWVVDKRSNGSTFRLREFTTLAEQPVYRVRLTGGGGYEVAADSGGATVASGMSGALARGDGFTLLLDELQGKAGESFRLSLAPFNNVAAGLRNGVRATEVGKGTNIIKLSYQHSDPRRAAEVINTLAQVYLERSVTLKTQEASRSVEFIAQQLEQVRATLNGAEDELENYKTTTGVVKLDSEAEGLIERLSETEKGLAAVTLRRKQAEFAVDALQGAIGRQDSYAPAILLDEPVVASLAQSMAQLEIERRGLLVEFSAAHPAVQTLSDRISETQGRLLSTYQTILQGLASSTRTLQGDFARYEAELKKLPGAELELARLTRRASVNADIYIFLLQKHEEARIAQASTISNINIIDPAIVPDKPIKPQKKKNLLLGLIVGAMAAVGIAFFREYLDDTIKDSDSAKRLLGVPTLALIPYIGRQDDSRKLREEGAVPPERTLIAHLEPRSAPAEAFRALRTALHFAGSGKKSQVLLVTSTVPGEGKTTISANLAVTMAQTGSRVLLVGCDLRKPTLHEMFNTNNSPGLTDHLIGDATIAAAVHATGIFNLDFISAGTVPPNPAELLGSTAMRELIEKLRTDYDLILLDAPPALAVTDAAVLTPLADRTIVVLQVGGVSTKAAQRTLEILRTTPTPIAGLVLNDKTNKGVDYYGYYGRYGKYAYGYGYGYGEGDGKEKRKG